MIDETKSLKTIETIKAKAKGYFIVLDDNRTCHVNNINTANYMKILVDRIISGEIDDLALTKDIGSFDICLSDIYVEKVKEWVKEIEPFFEVKIESNLNIEIKFGENHIRMLAYANRMDIAPKSFEECNKAELDNLTWSKLPKTKEDFIFLIKEYCEKESLIFLKN